MSCNIKMNEETVLIAYKSICNFVNDLESAYGKRHMPLRLYKRLINHTQIIHDQAIKKHIVIFHDFCVRNRDALNTQRKESITEGKIVYSDRVYIDMAYIFRLSDKETTPIIWQHLLTISAILDPVSKAKEVLRKIGEDNKVENNEADFLTNMISKVEQNVKPDSNPMEAISSMMSSGVLTDMFASMSSGKMDIGKLMNTVQGMVAQLSTQVGDDPESKQAMNMLNNMTSMMGNMGMNKTNQSENKGE